MSAKIRMFAVSAFEPTRRPLIITAHSRSQLARRISKALELDVDLFHDVTDALWKDSPVFMQDLRLVFLPGHFKRVSYQTLIPNTFDSGIPMTPRDASSS
jgi:hypothetical protein